MRGLFNFTLFLHTYIYLAFLANGESVFIFHPFMTGIAHAATGCKKIKLSVKLL